ncbi:MAG TPA: PEGA domain-containing protein, partial [Spirochaetia bacterium]|nr:PEGA domain-containing protein [Spirochaetia bacterium]
MPSRLSVALALALFALPALFAQNASSTPPPVEATLAKGGTASRANPATATFIMSNPIGAVVILDNKTLLSRTPLLLHGLGPGKHRVEIARRGYAPERTTFEVSKTKPTVVTVSLKQEYIDPIFDPSQKVLIDGKRADYAKQSYRLPTGEYRVGESDGTVSIDPVFPNQQILSLVDLATAGLVTASAVLVAQTIVSSMTPSATNNSNNNNMGGQIAVWVTAGFSTISDLFMHIQKARYLRAYAAATVRRSSSSANAEQLYNRAQSLLGSGSLTAAG